MKRLYKNSKLPEEIHCACTLDFASNRTVHLGGNASYLTGQNPTGLGSEFGKNLRILVANLLKRKVKALGRHRLVVLTEVNPALDGLGLRHNKIK